MMDLPKVDYIMSAQLVSCLGVLSPTDGEKQCQILHVGIHVINLMGEGEAAILM